MPLGDWQFWFVTVIVLLALAAIARPFLPRRARRRTRVNLTIDGDRRD